MGGHEGDEEEKSNEGHGGDESHGSHGGHEGNEEEKSNEGHGCDESHGSHEGHEGDEEEKSNEGHGCDESHSCHEGHEGDEEMKAMAAVNIPPAVLVPSVAMGHDLLSCKLRNAMFQMIWATRAMKAMWCLWV